jgi:DNA-binding protein HU-beta
MNKQEFAHDLADRCDFSKAEAGRVIDAVLETVTEALTDRDEVNLPGFGKFVAQKRRGREGTDPRNPDRKIHIAPGYVPKFKPGNALRRAVGDASSGDGQAASSTASPSRANASKAASPARASAPEAAPAEPHARTDGEAATSGGQAPRRESSDLGWRPLSER